MMNQENNWQQCNSETFWREIASCSHVVQIYENDEELLSLLEDFVIGGISVDDCVIIIATQDHLNKLEVRIEEHDLNIHTLNEKKQYFPLNAEKVLSKFMVDGLPDPLKFEKVVVEVFDQIRESKRQVRAFGEMVALLWAQGNFQATIKLEYLWNDLFKKESFSLFCAYPKKLFPEEAGTMHKSICEAHSKIITPTNESKFDLHFQDVPKDKLKTI